VPASSFGYFITLQFAAFSVAAFVGGALKERLRLSNYHMVTAGLLIISAAFFVGAVGLRSMAALIAWVIPLGLAGGAVETFSSIQISALSRAGSSKNLCLSQVFYSIGAFAAPQLVYIIFSAGLEWKSAFVIFGLFSTAILAFFLVFTIRRGDFAERRPVAAPSPEAVRSRSSVFYLLLLLMLAEVVMESLSAAWLSYVFEVRYLLTPRDASLVLVLFWAGMMAGRLSIVLLPVRWTMWPTLLVSAVTVLASTAGLAAVQALPARLVLVTLLGFCLGPIWPVIVMTASSTFQSEKLTSTIIGVGAIGFASGPLLGSLLLSKSWASGYFFLHLGLGVLIVVFCTAAWRLHTRLAAATSQGFPAGLPSGNQKRQT
jgi:MFS family permease